MNLIHRVASIPRGAEVIWNWLGEGGITVAQEEAQRRANICLNCPGNNVGGILKESLAEMVKRHIEVKNNLGLRVYGEKSLGECEVCLCQLRLKVWVPIELVKKHMLSDEPEKFKSVNPQCWQNE